MELLPNYKKGKCNCNKLLPTVDEREKRNKNTFTSVTREIYDNVIKQENETENKTSESTNRVFCLQKLGQC